jgi:hypothetical protein
MKQQDQLVYHHKGVTIWITETPRFWEGDLKRNSTDFGFVCFPKLSGMTFEDFLDECGRVIERGNEQSTLPPPRYIDGRTALTR